MSRALAAIVPVILSPLLAAAIAGPLYAQELGTVELMPHVGLGAFLEQCAAADDDSACGLRPVADHYCAIGVQSVPEPPCCIPESDATNARIRASVLAWIDDHPGRIDEDVNVALREALSRDHPCTPELMAAIPDFGDNFVFPSGILTRRPDGAEFLNHWWSGQLVAMEEAALAPRAGEGIEIYRMLVVPTFFPSHAVRIEHDGERTRVEYRKLDGAGGYDPGALAEVRSFEISAEQWADLSAQIAAADFFSSPTDLPNPPMVLDGTTWIFEGVRDGRYHVVHRHLQGGHFEFPAIYRLIQGIVGDPVTFAHVRRMREWDWFARILLSLEEPALYAEDGYDALEAYRLVALSDRSQPLSVRIQRDADGISAHVARFSGTAWTRDHYAVAAAAQRLDAPVAERSAYYRRIGVLTDSWSSNLDDADWQYLHSAVADAGFWTGDAPRGLPAHEGEVWIIEGFRSGLYEFAVLRPGRDGPPGYAALAELLFDIAR